VLLIDFTFEVNGVAVSIYFVFFYGFYGADGYKTLLKCIKSCKFRCLKINADSEMDFQGTLKHLITSFHDNANVNAWPTLKKKKILIWKNNFLFKMFPNLTLNQFYTMAHITYLTRNCFQI